MTAQQWKNDDANLSEFVRLGPQVYLHTPARSNTNPSRNAPDLIILCTWMGAPSRPTAKYVAGHIKLCPGTPVLLIRSALEDFMFRSPSTQISRMHSAAEVIKNHVKEAKSNGRVPKIFLQVFSNGGSWSACMLKEAYARITTDALPISAMVIDSAPSLPRARQGYNAMMQSVPRFILVRLVASCFIWILIGFSYIMDKLRLSKSVILRLRDVLNDSAGPFLTPTAPRTYICSKQDDMVPMEDVVLHASEARMTLERMNVGKAQQNISVEEFVGSKHVGHMMVDSIRYWKIIQETWRKAC